MDWFKLGQLGIGVFAVAGMIWWGGIAINRYFDSRKDSGSGKNDDSGSAIRELSEKVVSSHQENTKAIIKLTTFLETKSENERELRAIEAERVLSILGKVDNISKDVREGNNRTCEVLDRLKERPCQK